MTMRTRVLIADDRVRSRRGLRALLDLQPETAVVGEAADGREAVRLVEELGPDVVLMDVRRPVMDGLEATRRNQEQWPEVRVVVLTICAGYQAAALDAGADAFPVKGCPAKDLRKAILDHK
jgi:DNA-binding NarL/FixJ family response regulator